LELNSKYAHGFLNQLDASQRGEIVAIPNALERVGEVYNLMPSRYTLISGATGAGKTSFADYSYILAPWSWLEANPDTDIYWEVNYFSLERKQMFKHAKWVSWMMYRDDNNLLLSADQIMGWKNGPINNEGYNLVRSYDDEMSGLLEKINIYDGKVDPKVIYRKIQQRGHALGDLYRSDDEGVLFRDSPVYMERFDDKNLVEQTKLGPQKYILVNHKGTEFKIYEDDHRYFPHHKRPFVFFVVDGINLLGSKEVIDEISVALADARDIFGFSPVVVTQQNRAMGDIGRAKLHGSDLSPQLEDIFKSSQMGFDADLIIGLFDPHRYKAFNKQGEYGGYCIKPMEGHEPCTMTPGGIQRFRSAHILKNTFGQDGGVYGMKFLGECNHFATLPKPDDDILLQKFYAEIRSGI
jgi:hypothetical protein